MTGASLYSSAVKSGLPTTTAHKPAYISVKPRKVLTESPLAKQSQEEEPPKPPSNTAAGKPEWPPSLKDYVAKSFDSCPAEKRDAVEKQIKDLIVQTMQNQAMWTTDWDSLALPKYCRKPEPKVGAAKVVLPPPSEPSLPPPPTISKKRKKEQAKLSLMEPQSATSPSPSMTVSVSQSTVVSEDEEDAVLQRLPPSLRKAEIERREVRRARFQAKEDEMNRRNREKHKEIAEAKEAFLKAGAEGNPDVIDWDEFTIVGTSTRLDKNYLRLTSAPDPSTVRPLHILRQTLEMLIAKWKAEQKYTYICDQFKSLRQDLTVQRIKNEFTVAVYEAHGRIALEKGDLGEFNQCQAQLMQLYNRHHLRGCQDEFTGYRILYMVHTSNRTELVKLLGELTDEQKDGEVIKHALNVRTSVALSDYHRFFRLYGSAPRLSMYLMDHFVERERIRAMKSICRAFRPGIPVDYLAKELGFIHEDDVVNADVVAMRVGRKACVKWLREKGVKWITGEAGKTVDCKTSQSIFISHAGQISKKGVDIKGQIH